MCNFRIKRINYIRKLVQWTYFTPIKNVMN